MPRRFNKAVHTELARSLAREVKAFVDEMIIPYESLLARTDEQSLRMQADLMDKARSAGLCGLFYPLSHGGKINSLEDYMIVTEQEGRTEFSQAIFASHSALDAHMLLESGNKEIHRRFLEPMVNGDAVPSYGMTEPGHSGSRPSLIATIAHLSGGNWHINGRKWFISNADRATFMTVLARSGGKDMALNHALSMIIVPTDLPGFKIERQLNMMGHSYGQGEVSFTDVQVPEHYLLGACGSGLDLMDRRLGLGRLLRSMNWVGLAQRCMDLMGARIHSIRGKFSRLAEKQLVRQHIFNTYLAIVSACELIRIAARGIDAQNPDEVAINVAKMAASRALCTASDCAMQLHGAEGLTDLTPLYGISRIARTSRIMDGNDESLISSVGRRLIYRYQQQAVYAFD
ncbi:acyl-CoA dehydrogenase family protein [Nitrosomonas oligotropha]|uniref:acyl-CoA dehydrogenase family protein n=1 Tax=Nitrosomonas oligotropha TaxID=42354 RepID=UPI00136C1090|nr:acyl-CoA dehydrogenase family protein [Nitrosomonas oligotropha]MXS82745.1 acyl-CoA dehydrogenase family protein [Nitrosomonas oligotropha]